MVGSKFSYKYMYNKISVYNLFIYEKEEFSQNTMLMHATYTEKKMKNEINKISINLHKI